MNSAKPPATNGGRWLVAAFAVTQTIGYGCLFYAFAVLMHPIAADPHGPTACVRSAEPMGMRSRISCIGAAMTG